MTTIQSVQSTIDKIQARKDKPDHPKWEKFGNAIIYYVLPVVEVGIAQFVPPEFKAIAMFGYMVVSLLVKKLTKYTVDPKSK
jgi:hypothetical protein